MKGAFSRPGMAERWGAGAHGYSNPMARLRERVGSDIARQHRYLPGGGARREDEIALFSSFIFVAAQFLAAVTDRPRAAAALRRLADAVERGELEGRDT